MTQETDEFQIAQTILDQLIESKVNGLPFFKYTGITRFVLQEKELLLHLPKNAIGYECVDIIYDEGWDLYNLQFRNGLPLKRIENVYCDQMAEIIAREMGIL